MEKKEKVPVYKKWWFWVIIVLVLAGLFGGNSGSNTSESLNSNSNNNKKTVVVADLSSMTDAERDTWCKENNVNCYTDKDYSDTINKGGFVSQSIAAGKTIYEGDSITIVISIGKKPTVEQLNAVRKAESYLSFSAFSRKGLIEQLEYEGFSNADSTYAVDNVDVNWNEQAVKKANSYLDISGFSKQGLIEQLEYEGFTHEQAVYGAEQNGL